MAKNGFATKGQHHPPGHWGKWKGSICAHEGCGLPARCKGMCMSHYNKDRWAAGVRPPSYNQRSRREARLRRNYGIDLAHYESLLAEQGGVCAVCGNPPTKRNTRAHWDGKLCVDHCHSTGKIRGLLCNDCNLAVGYGRTEDTLRAAAEYVRSRS